MQMLINISEYQYESIKKNSFKNGVSPSILDAIRNGTPLPKGHGRLIDGDYLYNRFKANGIEKIEQGYLALEMIESEPTVIEADMGD